MMAAQDAQPFHWHYPDVDDKNFQLHGHGLSLLLLIIFSIALFFTLLCLYVRWACRSARSPGPAAGGPDGTPASCAPPSGLGAEAIKSLPVVLMVRRGGHAAGEEEEEEEDGGQCSICLGELAEGNKVKVLPGCGHAYHPECVDRWLRTRSSCPMCRAPLGELLLKAVAAAETRGEDAV